MTRTRPFVDVRLVCSLFGHRLGHDFKGRPICSRCELRFRIESPAVHAHELRMRAARGSDPYKAAG